jgi:hypothetical protein
MSCSPTCTPHHGRRWVPPSILAVVLVLQRLEGCSDREACDRFCYDLRWRYAAGVDDEQGGFAHTVLVELRARLRRSADPDRIFRVTRPSWPASSAWSGSAGCWTPHPCSTRSPPTIPSPWSAAGSAGYCARCRPSWPPRCGRRCSATTTTRPRASRPATGTTRPRGSSSWTGCSATATARCSPCVGCSWACTPSRRRSCLPP